MESMVRRPFLFNVSEPNSLHDMGVRRPLVLIEEFPPFIQGILGRDC